MELEVKESARLPDGQHYGKIESIEYRQEPYEYVDVFIKEEKTGFVLKYGAPQNVTEKTKLGKLLGQFRALVVGQRIDPEQVLLGKEVSFMAITEKTSEGEFVRIVDNSIKPR